MHEKVKKEIKRVNLIKVKGQIKHINEYNIYNLKHNIKIISVGINMSYSKLKSPYASTSKLQTYKPQYAIPHVVRMQNLLEQYDRENSYLNKQVLQLLGRKKQFDSQFGLSNRTLEQFTTKNKNYQIENIRAEALSKYPSNRQSSSQKLKRYEYVDSNDKTKSPIYEAKVRHTFETSARKQTKHYSYTPYQNIQEVDRPLNEYKNSYRNSSNGDSNRRAKINYLEEKNSSMNVKVRENSAKNPYIKPFLPTQQKIEKRNRPSNSRDQPEATSRFVNEEQLKNQRKMSSPSFHNSINSAIINKQPYIGKPVEADSSPSLTESPQKRKSIQNINDSMISLKSNKSRKSGIEVTSAEKPKSKQKNSEQIKIKQKQALKHRAQQIERQKQKQIEKQREIQKQIQKEKEKLLQKDILRERQRSMQIQRQIQKEKQKQKQALQKRQKQLQIERQKTKEKEKELILLRQKQQQRESGKVISPTKKQKTVTFADRTSYSPQIIIKPIENQQNLVQQKQLPYASQKQGPSAERKLQQYQSYRSFPNYVPLVTTLPFGQANPYFTIIPNNNPFMNKSHILPENANQIEIPKRFPSQEIQEQNPLGRKKSSQHKIEPSQKITYDQGGQNLPRKQSVGSLRANSRDKKKKYIKVISNDMIGSKIGQGYKK